MRSTGAILAEKSCRVSSETGILKKVIVHRPDEGIEMVTPGSAVDLLYEDIVYLPKMKEEHDIFASALRCFTGENNVLELQKMLGDVLEDQGLRQELLEKVSRGETLHTGDMKILAGLDRHSLASVLISGSLPGQAKRIFDPLPNFIFTRDTGVIINDHLLICRAAKAARYRESLICSLIYRYHTEFRYQLNDDKIIDYSSEKENLSLEGGDVMILEPGHLLLATSERTTVQAAGRLSDLLLERGIVNTVTRIDMPKMRACMHLDTIFTRVSKDLFVGYDPLTGTDGAMGITHYTGPGKSKKYPSLKTLFHDILPQAYILPCADAEMPYAEREQWTDGCNLFAVKDGVAFTYDRNYRTNLALQKRGFSLIAAKDFLEQVKKGTINPSEVTNTIITIPSSELSRARGGPHCLTMPILRL